MEKQTYCDSKQFENNYHFALIYTTSVGSETKESKEVKAENETRKDEGASNSATSFTNNRSRS